jgi:hypothetical protein
MAEYGQDGITVRVRKGVQINVEEVDEFRDSDERVGADRDAKRPRKALTDGDAALDRLLAGLFAR